MKKRRIACFLLVLTGIGIGTVAGWNLITADASARAVSEAPGEGKDANETEDIYITEAGLMKMEDGKPVPYESSLSEEERKLLKEISTGTADGWSIIVADVNEQTVSEALGEGEDANETEDIYITEAGLMKTEDGKSVPYEASLSEEK